MKHIKSINENEKVSDLAKIIADSKKKNSGHGFREVHVLAGIFETMKDKDTKSEVNRAWVELIKDDRVVDTCKDLLSIIEQAAK